jgi:cytochrome bd ubiquinol oxidase subunit II
MSMSTDWLPAAYAALAAFCFLCYVLMDGWDLGVGILYPLVARKPERDQMFQSIAPFWDANETWLVFGGMTLLLGFPLAYSLLLTNLYIPVFAMLFALVLRGCSYEFRYQGGALQEAWGYVFAGGSVLAAFAQGYILGRVVVGFDPSPAPTFALSALRHLFPLVCGVGLVGGYGLLGACWLILKTRDTLQTTAREVGQSTLLLTLVLLIAVSTWTPLVSDHVAKRWFSAHNWPLLAIYVAASVALAWKLWRSFWQPADRRPLQWAIALFVISFSGIAISLYPYIIPYQHTLYEIANDRASLAFGAVGICVVLPVILLYLVLGYRVFRGKLTPAIVAVSAPATIAARKTCGHQVDLHLS